MCPKRVLSEELFKEYTNYLEENEPAQALEFLQKQNPFAILNYKSKTGETPLHIAIYYANRHSFKNDDGIKNTSEDFNALINYLLNIIKLSPNAPDTHGMSPLIYAGRFLLIDVFTMVLNQGGDVSATSSKGHTIEDMMGEYHDSPGKRAILELLLLKNNRNSKIS